MGWVLETNGWGGEKGESGTQTSMIRSGGRDPDQPRPNDLGRAGQGAMITNPAELLLVRCGALGPNPRRLASKRATFFM